eukprot:5533587-Prymnesium_polylepis.1
MKWRSLSCISVVIRSCTSETSGGSSFLSSAQSKNGIECSGCRSISRLTFFLTTFLLSSSTCERAAPCVEGRAAPCVEGRGAHSRTGGGKRRVAFGAHAGRRCARRAVRPHVVRGVRLTSEVDDRPQALLQGLSILRRCGRRARCPVDEARFDSLGTSARHGSEVPEIVDRAQAERKRRLPQREPERPQPRRLAHDRRHIATLLRLLEKT